MRYGFDDDGFFNTDIPLKYLPAVSAVKFRARNVYAGAMHAPHHTQFAPSYTANAKAGMVSAMRAHNHRHGFGALPSSNVSWSATPASTPSWADTASSLLNTYVGYRSTAMAQERAAAFKLQQLQLQAQARARAQAAATDAQLRALYSPQYAPQYNTQPIDTGMAPQSFLTQYRTPLLLGAAGLLGASLLFMRSKR